MASYPKSIFITGANSGIGLGFVKHVLEQGKGTTEHVWATHRRPLGDEATRELEQLAKDNSDRLHLIRMDVRQQDTIRAAVEEVEKVVGADGLNVLVSNSGVAVYQFSLQEITAETLTNHVQVNTIGAFLVLKEFHGLLKRAAEASKEQPLGWKRSAVLYTSSIMGSLTESSGDGQFAVQRNPLFRTYSYRASKAALNMLAHSMAPELADDGIGTLLMHPGWVQTNLGGDQAPLTVEDSVSGLVRIAQALDTTTNGKHLSYDGEVLAW
ncbi:C-signal-like [Sycon ciliatum]|uniref:C-signal-like n=1 Tax=Sycon ciliatum TaxID=27933 RepID=UPI0020ADC98E|eukprot:scpid56646/ scgid28647/ Uncharacterized oxidoreductase C663.09c